MKPKPQTPNQIRYQKNKVRQLLRIKSRKDQWFKDNGPCKKCGSWSSLEADHIDRTTKMSDNYWSWSTENMMAELSKCQVLCHACHRQKTSLELSKPKEHGTLRMYNKYRCRCDLCRRVKTDHSRLWFRSLGGRKGMRELGYKYR